MPGIGHVENIGGYSESAEWMSQTAGSAEDSNWSHTELRLPPSGLPRTVVATRNGPCGRPRDQQPARKHEPVRVVGDAGHVNSAPGRRQPVSGLNLSHVGPVNEASAGGMNGGIGVENRGSRSRPGSFS